MVERNRLPRKLSLKRRVDIQDLLRRGRRVSGECFVCAWQPELRFGYAVLVSKAFGSAVQRNRIKRLLRESLRLRRQKLKRPVYLAVLPRKSMGKPSFERFDHDMQRAIEAINKSIQNR